jgi:hypothetical protein
MGFTLKTVKSLIGIGLMSFDPCGRIFLAEQGFLAVDKIPRFTYILDM